MNDLSHRPAGRSGPAVFPSAWHAALRTTLFSAALACAMPAFAASPPSYKAEIITGLPDQVLASGLNQRGDFTVSYWQDERGRIGLLRDGSFSTLALPAGSDMAYSAQINEAGQVLSAGYKRTLLPTGNGGSYYEGLNYQPFLYENGRSTLLNTELEGGHASYHKLNDVGDVVGTIVKNPTDSTISYQPFIYHSTTAQTELVGSPLTASNAGQPYPGYASAIDINNVGQVFMVQSSEAGAELLVLKDGQVTSLFKTDAGRIGLNGVNDAGQVLFSTGDPIFLSELYLYDGHDTIRLGRQRFIPPTGQETNPDEMYGRVELEGFIMGSHLMDDGTVLGQNSSFRPVLYKHGQTFLLNDLVAPLSPEDKGLWSVYDVAGERILASDGLGHSVVLTPTSAVPEPASLLLLSAGLVGMGLVSARKRARAA